VQAGLLSNRLKEHGYPVVITREPGGTRIGEQIRAITHDTENVDLDPKTEAYLMAAARAQHVVEIIEPALENGSIVICDRYLDSSIAYQGYGRKLGDVTIRTLNQLAVNGAIPDISILLDISPEEGLKRRLSASKKTDRLDLQDKDFYERVHEGYLHLAKQRPSQYVVIDGNKSIEEISEEIWKSLQHLLTQQYGNKQ
jgi:dTMP kinase